MRIVRVEDYLLVHLSVGETHDGRDKTYLERVLVFGITGARFSMTLGAAVSLPACPWMVRYARPTSSFPPVFASCKAVRSTCGETALGNSDSIKMMAV